MQLQRTIKAIVRKGEQWYVAECVEIAVVTQGKTLDELLKNLQEAVALHLEGEDPTAFGLVPNPTILITMELEPEYAEVEAVVR
jgi:predicted RNase H-like HicB family nuclease